MKIIKTDKKITFEFPRFQKRFNPYDEDGDYGYYPTFTGLIIRNKNGLDEVGFAGTIDMGYKDKADQVSDFIVKWHGDEEDFIKECKNLQLEIEIYDYTEK